MMFMTISFEPYRILNISIIRQHLAQQAHASSFDNSSAKNNDLTFEQLKKPFMS